MNNIEIIPFVSKDIFIGEELDLYINENVLNKYLHYLYNNNEEYKVNINKVKELISKEAHFVTINNTRYFIDDFFNKCILLAQNKQFNKKLK